MNNIIIAAKRVLKVIGNFLLIGVAFLIFLFLSVAGTFWSIYSLLYKRTIGVALDGISLYFLSIALSIDKLGNTAFTGLLNETLINKSKYKEAYTHGDSNESISFVIGCNKQRGTLSNTGKVLAKVLNIVDKGHVDKTVDKVSLELIKKINNNKDIFKVQYDLKTIIK